MPLTAGTRLGPYEIVAPLGAGGMGEVYRARDTRLGRDVAVKVLAQHLSASAEVRARFEREAKTVSSLNHPHICTLHDVGREGETDFLVMELVEGETLAHRLVRGALPTAEVLKLGAQIADALDRAHRAGVIHRDLKPGNVMLTKSGAKLMDFGLARATGLAGPISGSGATVALTQSPTVAEPLTAEGTIVGTFQYMAPEQLEGKEADARADLWALGCVLYEIATGRRAFEGPTQASLISSIMRDTPRSMAELAPMNPPALERLVGALLAKDPDDRIQTAHDAKLQLQWAGAPVAVSTSGAAVAAQAPAPRRGRERMAWTIAALAGVAAVGAAAALVGSRGAAELPTIRAIIPAPAGATYLFAGDNAGPPVLSPDGRRLAFVAVDDRGGARIWVRELASLTAASIPGTENATYPFWSPDGRALAFFADQKLKRVDLANQQVMTLCKALGGRGGTWNARGQIVFAPDFQTGLQQVQAMGGTPEILTTCDSTHHTTHRWPQFLPDGNHFLYFAGNHADVAGPDNAVWVGALDGKGARELMPSATEAHYRDGHLFYVRDSVLVARPFDMRSLRFTGDAVPMRERVQFDPTTWKANFSLAAGGLLAYQTVGGRQGSEVRLLDRSGKTLTTVATGGNHFAVRISRDGRRVAYNSQINPNGDLLIHDLDRGLTRRLTRSESDEDMPTFSPDGQRILYTARYVGAMKGHYALHMIPVDGAGAPRLIYTYARDIWPLDWSRDGRLVLVGVGTFTTPTADSLGVLSLNGSPTIRWIDTASAALNFGRFSNDGRWIVYGATVGADQELFLAPVPGAGVDRAMRLQISAAGGMLPQWRAGDRELCYLAPDGRVVSVTLASGTLEPGPETTLFRALLRPVASSLDMTEDGERFVVNTLASEGAAPIILVTNWKDDLAHR